MYTNATVTRHAERTKTKFGKRVASRRRRNNLFQILSTSVRGFRAVRAKNWGLPLSLTVALTTGQHYRAACDVIVMKKSNRTRMCRSIRTSYGHCSRCLVDGENATA